MGTPWSCNTRGYSLGECIKAWPEPFLPWGLRRLFPRQAIAHTQFSESTTSKLGWFGFPTRSPRMSPGEAPGIAGVPTTHRHPAALHGSCSQPAAACVLVLYGLRWTHLWHSPSQCKTSACCQASQTGSERVAPAVASCSITVVTSPEPVALLRVTAGAWQHAPWGGMPTASFPSPVSRQHSKAVSSRLVRASAMEPLCRDARRQHCSRSRQPPVPVCCCWLCCGSGVPAAWRHTGPFCPAGGLLKQRHPPWNSNLHAPAL